MITDDVIEIFQKIVLPLVTLFTGLIYKDIRQVRRDVSDMKVSLAKTEGKLDFMWETGKHSPKMREDLNFAFHKIREIEKVVNHRGD